MWQSFLVLFAISQAVAVAAIDAREVIPPRDARAQASLKVAAASVVAAPLFVRSDVPELARVRVEQADAVDRDGLRSQGIVHTLAAPLRLSLSATGVAAGSLAPVAVGKVVVEGAPAVRLRFSGLPEGTVLWVAGEEEEAVRFVASANAAWGPTTRGESVVIAAENYGDEIVVSELATVAAATQGSACLQDVACADLLALPELEQASRAIAYIRFVRDGQSYVCTGGLLNDASGSGTPYLLTARHCIASQEQASSVEVVWDLRSSACGSNRMAPVSRSYGAQLLVASERTDVALLKLDSVPADRVFLGIDLRPLAAGQAVYHLSHASGLSQTYAGARVDGDGGSSCLRAPRGPFIYSDPVAGAIAPGSSGAPMLTAGLSVTGQLLGLCGADPSNACATFNAVVDGSIRESWPLLAPYLDPSPEPARRRAVR